jgi:hypothetical protein
MPIKQTGVGKVTEENTKVKKSVHRVVVQSGIERKAD